MYGASLAVHDEATFYSNYGDQASTADAFHLAAPSYSTLVEWAKSCLGLGSFKSMPSSCGWSPFRSGELRVRCNSEGTTKTFYYKLGDTEEYDLHASTDPQIFPLRPWVDTLKQFVQVALKICTETSDQKCQLPPRGIVAKMLHREWGSAGHAFTKLLQGRLDPSMFDAMVQEAWDRMVRVPMPCVFKYACDSTVQRAIVHYAATQGARKGLRV